MELGYERPFHAFLYRRQVATGICIGGFRRDRVQRDPEFHATNGGSDPQAFGDHG